MKTFVSSMCDMVNNHGYDGVDLDMEEDAKGQIIGYGGNQDVCVCESPHTRSHNHRDSWDGLHQAAHI